ncbi:MAG: HPP family protein [Polyangiales bacterium]
MSSNSRSNARLGWLEVRVRRTIAGDGSETRRLAVFCPFRARLTPVLECTLCGHGTDFSKDRSSGASAICCRRIIEEPERADVQEAAPDAALTDVGRAADHTRVSELIGPELICVREDLSVESLTAMLLDRGLAAVPVVDELGRAVGVVSKSDLIRERREGDDQNYEESIRVPSAHGYEYELGPGFHADRIARAIVREVMTPFLFSIHEDESVARASALMAYEGVHGLAVVTKTGELTGMLSASDVFRWIARSAGYVVPTFGRPQG